MQFHPLTYTTAQGPLGFPVTDRQAIALDAILKALPKDDAFAYRKVVIAKGATEVLAGNRCDVSWISTEDPDRVKHVVSAKGMNDSQFKHNPIVTMDHHYCIPPVGKSLWRKVVKEGSLQGIKAKTNYPEKPGGWPANEDWPADIAFSLIQADLLRGKSIGLLPTKVHYPKAGEAVEKGWTQDVDVVIDEWLLIEYACTFLPIQQNALIEAVSKSAILLPEAFMKVMGINPSLFTKPSPEPTEFTLSRFTPLEEIEKAIQRRISSINIPALAEHAAKQALERAKGKV